jgi:hypothetical protein
MLALIAAMLVSGAGQDWFYASCLASGGQPGRLLLTADGQKTITLYRGDQPALVELSVSKAGPGSELVVDGKRAAPIELNWGGAASGRLIQLSARGGAGPMTWCVRARPL